MQLISHFRSMFDLYRTFIYGKRCIFDFASHLTIFASPNRNTAMKIRWAPVGALYGDSHGHIFIATVLNTFKEKKLVYNRWIILHCLHSR